MQSAGGHCTSLVALFSSTRCDVSRSDNDGAQSSSCGNFVQKGAEVCEPRKFLTGRSLITGLPIQDVSKDGNLSHSLSRMVQSMLRINCDTRRRALLCWPCELPSHEPYDCIKKQQEFFEIGKLCAAATFENFSS